MHDIITFIHAYMYGRMIPTMPEYRVGSLVERRLIDTRIYADQSVIDLTLFFTCLCMCDEGIRGIT